MVTDFSGNKKSPKAFYFRGFHREATTGFEPVIRVLQTHALPLGYVAIYANSSLSWTRTNDTAVNSRVLYRLSYQGIGM